MLAASRRHTLQLMNREQLTIPNIITVARILVTPLMAVMLARDPVAWAIPAILIGLTDVLDGFLARRFNWITELGRILDPTADVIYTSAIAIALAVAGVLPVPLMAATLLQKALKTVITGMAAIRLKGVKTHVTDFGKAVEVVTNVGVAGFMLAKLTPDEWYDPLRIVATVVTIAGILAGFINAWRMYQQYQQIKADSQKS